MSNSSMKIEGSGWRPSNLSRITSVRRLSRIGLASTVALIAFGAFTRGSGSGYGCADRWPLCKDGALGGLLPRLEFEMIIEWTHRWIAVLVGLIAVATAVQAWRRHRSDRVVVVSSIGAVGTIVVQALIGRAIVQADLAADLVSLHLALSITIAALFVVTVVATSPEMWVSDTVDPRQVALFGLGAAGSFAVLLLGSLVHNQYVAGWPLIQGAWLPEFSTSLILIHWTHRLAAGLGFFYFGFLWISVRKRGRPRIELHLTGWAFGVYAMNVAVGLLHVLTQVESSTIVTLHLAASTVVWVLMVAATSLSILTRSRQVVTT